MGAAMTVGDFSRVTHLSIKTLRHYHEVGLLEPANVDPGNGYRCYRPEQVPTAQVIRRLRDLGMPVAEVKAALAADDLGARNAVIVAHLDRLEADLAATRSAVESLRNLLQHPATAAASIEHRTVRAASAIGIHATVDRGEVGEWWQGALGELRTAVRVQGLRQAGPSGGLYASELFQHDRGEATVFIPVEGAVRAVGRVARTERTETSEARLREALDEVRQRGYAVVIDELEYGITGIAVPVIDGTTVVGAVGCVTPSGYQTAEELVATRLPAIRTAAERIAEELRRFPAFSDSVRWH